MNGNISRVLKAPTQPVTDFTSLQRHLLFSKFLFASLKEDGIRCIIHPVWGVCSQTMKSIPNRHVRHILEQVPLNLDGELVGLRHDGTDMTFNETQSAIMTEDGFPRFEYRVFDWFGNCEQDYEQRSFVAIEAVQEARMRNVLNVKWLRQFAFNTISKIEEFELSALEKGKEGIMLRRPDGVYKQGRSTFDQGYLLKVKRFMDDEAVVIGVEEEMENCNLATRDTGGLQRRSKHQAGLRGKGMVGALICKWQDKILKVASGMTEGQKIDWWHNQQMIVNKTITFKYQAHGMKDLPRCPIFKGIRRDV